MKFRAGLLLFGLFLAPVQIFANDADALLLVAVGDCTELLATEEFDRSDLINTHCPKISEQLQGSSLGAVVSSDRFSDLSFAELWDIQNILTASLDKNPTNISFSYSNLDQILADTLIVDAGAKELSWWDKFLAWLENKLRAQDSADLQWLQDILRALSFSEETQKYILYGSLATIILLALTIVVNELKAGGVFGRIRFSRRRRAGGALTSPSRIGSATNQLTPGAIQNLPQQQQAQALMNMCINHLIRAGRLPDDRSRTNREFLGIFSGKNNQSLVQNFRGLVERAERSLYGGEQLSFEALSECFEDSRRLLGTAVAT